MKIQSPHYYLSFFTIILLSYFVNFFACSESNNPTEPQMRLLPAP